VRSANIRARGTRALYGVPLIAEDELIGVALMGSRTTFEFSNEDKLLFRTMVSRATGLFVQTRLRLGERAAREEMETRTREQAETLALLDSLLATAPIGLSFVDRELRYVRINRMLADINGVPVEQSLGRTVREVLPEEADRLEPLLRQVFETGEPLRDAEVALPSKEDAGRSHHYLVSIYPVPDKRDEVRWVGSVVVDITERQRTEEELRRAAEFRERFLGIVSHDLRNPLNAILLSANVLMCSDDLPARHLKSVRRIATSAERMARMIGELLDFTRGRLGGGIPVSPRPTNLRQLCRHVLEELEVGHPGRELRLDAVGDLQGEWDPDRLAQVVGNLGKNALDYSPEGTPVRVSLRDEGDVVVLEVNNAGPPIPGARLAAIFEPFRRGSGGIPHPASGLGLGLFIVEQIVQAHGGSVSVCSSEEAGTTFTVRLPRHVPPRSEAAH
jgi:PAS domain S-box-containing protein